MTDDDLLLLWAFFSHDPLVAAGLQPCPVPVDLPFTLPTDPSHLPIVAGAAPGTPWEWAWDRIQDIIAGAWDLIEKIGRMVAELLQGIWEWVGGALRWVWENMTSWWWWLVGSLQSLLNNLWAGITDARNAVLGSLWDAGRWVRDRVWDAAGWVKDRVWEGALWGAQRAWEVGTWVKDRLWEAATWVKDRAWEVGTWMKDRVWDAATWLKDRVWDAAHWVSDETWKMATWAGERINSAASWTVHTLLPPLMGAMGDMGDAFRDAFDLVGGAIMDAGDALRDALVEAIKWPYEHIWEPYIDLLEHKLAIPGRLARGEYGSLGRVLDDVFDPPQFAFAGMAGQQLFSTALGFTAAMVLSALLQPLMVQPTQMMTARVGAQLLTVGVIQEALDRGFIDEAIATDHLSRAGYSGPALQALIKLAKQMPGASDLMRMADKRVWALQVPEQYGQYSELPDQVIQFMDQVGYSEEWTRNFWRAHWDLPSPVQIFEMFHRRVITTDDMQVYLGLTDWLPFFRDKLLAISFNPITRVDLRRLFKAGIISEDQVFDGYRDLGYNDEKARALTEFTKKWATPEDTITLDDFSDLAVSTIRTAYRRHAITREDALDKIVDTGVTEDLADFYLAIDDAQLAVNPTTEAGIPVRDLTIAVITKAYREKIWDRARAQQELEVLGLLPWEADLYLQLEDLDEERELAGLEEDVVKEQYLANAIDKAGAGAQLDALGTSPERRDLLLRRWELQRAQKPKRLTLAQLQKALKAGLFSESEFLDELSVQGYNDRDAQVILAITPGAPTE